MDVKTSIFRYCDYQERSHKEVRNKLYELGCKTYEVEQYLAELIEANLVNEERYAKAVVRGKFRLKGWGRNKIVAQLKQQSVSEYCIRKGLQEIDEQEYLATLERLMVKKLSELRTERNQFRKRAKLYAFLLQRGYEASIIGQVHQKLIAEG
jgi:regulatory protein